MMSDTDTKYSTEGHPQPLEAGDKARDEKEGKTVWIVERTDLQSDEYVLYETDSGAEETIASHHRGQYPADDEVLLGVYQENLSSYLRRLDRDVDRDRLLDVLRVLEVGEISSQEGWNVKVYGFPSSRLGRP